MVQRTGIIIILRFIPREHNMIHWLKDNPTERTLKRMIIFSVLLLLVSAPAIIWLLESSNFPGGLDETQLGFDGEYIRECFSTMNEQDINTFIQGNIADYVFMLSYGLMFFSSALFLTRKLNEGRIKQLGYILCILGVGASCCDAIENVFIISMALNPVQFPEWLAIPHSIFAHLKFNLMYITSGGILLLIIMNIIYWVQRKTLRKGLIEKVEMIK